VRPRLCLEVLEKRKAFASTGIQTPDLPVHSRVAVPTALLLLLVGEER
jgi:hypothetical protein